MNRLSNAVKLDPLSYRTMTQTPWLFSSLLPLALSPGIFLTVDIGFTRIPNPHHQPVSSTGYSAKAFQLLLALSYHTHWYRGHRCSRKAAPMLTEKVGMGLLNATPETHRPLSNQRFFETSPRIWRAFQTTCPRPIRDEKSTQMKIAFRCLIRHGQA